MKKSALFIFITYIWTKVLLGLVIHPYKYVRQITRNKILLPVVLSPLYALVGLFVGGRFGTFFFEFSGIKRELLAFMLSSGLLSILLWQLLLLYLLFNFLLALRKP